MNNQVNKKLEKSTPFGKKVLEYRKQNHIYIDAEEKEFAMDNFQSFAQNSHLGIGNCFFSASDCMNNIYQTNGKSLDISGYARRELTSGGTLQLICKFPSIDQKYLAETLTEGFNQIVESLKEHKKSDLIWNFEHLFTRSDGTLIWILNQTHFTDISENYPTVMLCSFTDITHFKKDNFNSSYFLDKKAGEILFQKQYSNSFLKALNLTLRELEVINLLAEGYSSKEIADRLFITLDTVQIHRKNILCKTKVKRSGELIKFVFQKGLIKDCTTLF